jgi:hypothetical protein
MFRSVMMLLDNGDLFIWGRNQDGELGNGATQPIGEIQKHPKFTDIATPIPIEDVSLGAHHSILLTRSGIVSTSGKTTHGQRMSVHFSKTHIPLTNFTTSMIQGVFAGYLHSHILVHNHCFGISDKNLTVCSSQGTCFSKNACRCNSNWFGIECNFTKCFGKESWETNICSGNGSCTKPDHCDCYRGFGGIQCDLLMCENVLATNKSVCSGSGTCRKPDHCDCLPGFLGNNCEYWFGGSINHNSSQVCQGRGYCGHPDECVCNRWIVGLWVGSNCSLLFLPFFVVFAIFVVLMVPIPLVYCIYDLVFCFRLAMRGKSVSSNSVTENTHLLSKTKSSTQLKTLPFGNFIVN